MFFLHLDCRSLQKAMKSLGTDEDMLIYILGNRSNAQRVHICDKYKQMFGKVSIVVKHSNINLYGYECLGFG